MRKADKHRESGKKLPFDFKESEFTSKLPGGERASERQTRNEGEGLYLGKPVRKEGWRRTALTGLVKRGRRQKPGLAKLASPAE